MKLIHYPSLSIIFLYIFFFSSFLAIPQTSFSQQSPKGNWKKLVKKAKEHEKYGDFLKAAEYYESAYAFKRDKKEYIYKAGQYYYDSREFKKALTCYKELETNSDFNNNAAYALTYGKILKLNDNCKAAIRFLEAFKSRYFQSDEKEVKEKLMMEIEGCKIISNKEEYFTENIEIIHLDSNINSPRTDYAPIPVSEGILYFSSTWDGSSKIYGAQKQADGTWTPKLQPTIFLNKISKPHFGNGSFSKDGKRFFFTQCDVVDGAKVKCQIYLMMEENGEWTAPIRLSDSYNEPNANTTHPFLVELGNKEYLFFSSDRSSGKGGMDIWYCSRELNAADFDFNEPKNASEINTSLDEITPVFDLEKNLLFFSSNGWPGIGGFDIFKSNFTEERFSKPVNIGLPFNSNHDEYNYITSDNHFGGYFVSNRTFENSKTETSHDDIFYFKVIEVYLTLKGKIFDENDSDKKSVKDAFMRFYATDDNGSSLFIEKDMWGIDEYQFELPSNKNFKLEVTAKGFETYTTEISTKAITPKQIRMKEIALKPLRESSKDTQAIAQADKKTEVDPDYPKYILVGKEFNSAEKPFAMPKALPVNPQTNKPYEMGSKEYDAIILAYTTAAKSPEKKVFWKNGVLVPYIPPVVAKVEEIKKTEPVTPVKKEEKIVVQTEPKPTVKAVETVKKEVNPKPDEILPADNNAKGTVFKIQISAVKTFRTEQYKDVVAGELSQYKLVFEKIGEEVTRVLLVPMEKNKDGSEGFSSKDEAYKALQKLVSKTKFKESFIGMYSNGKRMGEIFK